MLQHQILEIKKQNLQNQQEIEELEQYDRRLCLRFEGIPTEKNETSGKDLEKIMGICKDSDVEIPDTVIDWTHRIDIPYVDKTTKKSCKSVIVRFSTFCHRTIIVHRAKKNINSPVRVKIDLTKKRYNLLYCKQICKQYLLRKILLCGY